MLKTSLEDGTLQRSHIYNQRIMRVDHTLQEFIFMDGHMNTTKYCMMTMDIVLDLLQSIRTPIPNVSLKTGKRVDL